MFISRVLHILHHYKCSVSDQSKLLVTDVFLFVHMDCCIYDFDILRMQMLVLSDVKRTHLSLVSCEFIMRWAIDGCGAICLNRKYFQLLILFKWSFSKANFKLACHGDNMLVKLVCMCIFSLGSILSVVFGFLVLIFLCFFLFFSFYCPAFMLQHNLITVGYLETCLALEPIDFSCVCKSNFVFIRRNKKRFHILIQLVQNHILVQQFKQI